MQNIADETGISKSSLYFYFNSKETIFKEVYEYCHKLDVDACNQGIITFIQGKKGHEIKITVKMHITPIKQDLSALCIVIFITLLLLYITPNQFKNMATKLIPP